MTDSGQSVWMVEVLELAPLRLPEWESRVDMMPLEAFSSPGAAIARARQLAVELSAKLDLAYVVCEYVVDHGGGEEIWTSHQMVPGRPDYLAVIG